MILNKLPCWEQPKNNCIVYLDSMAELVDEADRIDPYFDNEGRYSWTFGYDNEFNTREKTKEKLILGLSTQKIMDDTIITRDKVSIIDSIQELGVTHKRKRQFSEAGSELSIDRVLCGDPLHWETRVSQPRKCIKIGINYCLGSSNSEDTFKSLCSLSIVTCEQLINRGYSVEILAIMPAKFHSNRYHKSALIIKLKDASEPLDIARLCSIGIPGMLRYYSLCVCKYYFGNDQGNPITTDIRFFKEHLGIEYVISKNNADSPGDFLSNIIKSL